MYKRQLPALDGSAITGVAATENIRTNTNATFLQNVNVSGTSTIGGASAIAGNVTVGSGITLSPDGDVFVAGISTFVGIITASATENIVPFLFNNYSDLPSATEYHGAFAHVHVAGKAFYAHAGAWRELVNVGSELTVGLGTEKYNVGIISATNVNVSDSVVAPSFEGGGNGKFVSAKWTVTANGSSAYLFDGPGGLDASNNNPTIYLARGQTYEFVNNSGGSHPFQIQSNNSGTAYNVGVTNNNASSGTIKFEVPFASPNTLYYQCTNHSGMLGTIVVYPSTS